MTVTALLLLACFLPSAQLELPETRLTVEHSVESRLESKFVHPVDKTLQA